MAIEEVILVNEKNQEVGTEEKLRAHKNGLLHRAFSIFVFDSRNRLLLQKRAKGKYHSGGLWSNTCCGHPRPKERLRDAAERRLHEELGFSCPLFESFDFLYRAELPNGLMEHEFDHVLTGHHDGDIRPNPDEVEEWQWIDLESLKRWMEATPESFTFWFLTAVQHQRWLR